MTNAPPMARRLLVDHLPGKILRIPLGMLLAMALTAGLAQVELILGWTPVPITGQTLGAMLAGAALGPIAGGLSQAGYLLAGLYLPVFAGGASGSEVLFGPTGGYLFGMVIASVVVGALARARWDRKLTTAVPSMMLATAIIYGVGVPWLAVETGTGIGAAISDGLLPFIVGDTAKAAIAGLVTSLLWRSNARN
jgi:biotin transport system substrate-specific component